MVSQVNFKLHLLAVLCCIATSCSAETSEGNQSDLAQSDLAREYDSASDWNDLKSSLLSFSIRPEVVDKLINDKDIISNLLLASEFESEAYGSRKTQWNTNQILPLKQYGFVTFCYESREAGGILVLDLDVQLTNAYRWNVHGRDYVEGGTFSWNVSRMMKSYRVAVTYASPPPPQADNYRVTCSISGVKNPSAINRTKIENLIKRLNERFVEFTLNDVVPDSRHIQP